MGDQVYNSEMTDSDRHAVYHIRADLNTNKDPLGKLGRKRTSEVAALPNFPRGSLLVFRSALIWYTA